MIFFVLSINGKLSGSQFTSLKLVCNQNHTYLYLLLKKITTRLENIKGFFVVGAQRQFFSNLKHKYNIFLINLTTLQHAFKKLIIGTYKACLSSNTQYRLFQLVLTLPYYTE